MHDRKRDLLWQTHTITEVYFFVVNPVVDYLTTVKNILKYLKITKDMFLIYGCDKELVVNGYVDASFDTDPDD